MFRSFAVLTRLVFSAANVRAPDLPHSPDPIGDFVLGYSIIVAHTRSLAHYHAEPWLTSGLQGKGL